MKCPNCQMNVSDGAKSCLHCGTQFSYAEPSQMVQATVYAPVAGSFQPTQNSSSVTYSQPTVITQKVNQEAVKEYQQKETKKYVIQFILSLVNMAVLYPVIVKYSLVWLLIAALTSKELYYVVLIGIILYAIASIVWVVRAIWNLIKENKILRILYIGFFVVLILLSVGYYVWYRFF